MSYFIVSNPPSRLEGQLENAEKMKNAKELTERFLEGERKREKERRVKGWK